MHLRSSRMRALPWIACCVWLIVAGTHPTSAQVNVSEWPQVQVEVVGTDAGGDPLKGLSASDVQVREDRRTAGAIELKSIAEPMSLCLLIDSSGSMYKSLNDLRVTLERLLQELPAEDDVCVADFSSAGFIDQELTTDRKADLKGLAYIKASGGTALYDMLAHLAEYMRKNARHSSRAILLFSDGEDNASRMKEPALRKEWKAPGTPALHIVTVPQSNPLPGHGRSGDEKAAIQLANMGGGLVYFPRNLVDMEASVDQLNQALKSRYLLTYQSGNSSKDGGERRIDVELDKVHQKAKAVVRAPEGYYAPSQ
jgi:Ca-activated chloride channel family protein